MEQEAEVKKNKYGEDMLLSLTEEGQVFIKTFIVNHSATYFFIFFRSHSL